MNVHVVVNKATTSLAAMTMERARLYIDEHVRLVLVAVDRAQDAVGPAGCLLLKQSLRIGGQVLGVEGENVKAR